ncbi:MAG TPA: MBL fold metallo-hydrolase, partial [Candidatus Rifleibacterium sp.]|nr:MBL fold metallo-hydrolase [Candidatus Rifleibacterium sp.]
DATAVENGRLILPNPQFTLDMSRALDSIRRIQSLKINSIINYHGGIYSGDIVNALGRVLAANSSLQA